ncbi:MAG: sulfatase [Planctomycetes bacterium]|nr:sulfatase [Planctomycetota bacterium]
MSASHRPPLGAKAASTALLFGALGLGVCSFGCTEPESFEAESYLDSLITQTERRVVKRVPEGRKVQPGTITPVTGKNSHAGMRSALLMPPVSEVTFTIPEDIGQSTYLRFAAGVDHSSYNGGEGAEVRFVVLLRGEPVYHANVPFNKALPEIQRRWEEGEVPLAGGGELTLRVDGDGAGLEDVKSGFSELNVIKKMRRVRARSTIEEPNVILIVLDTLRADRLGTYGDTSGLTPGLDALAERGVVFDRAYAASPWTWPSTASLLTSLSPPQHGIVGSKSSFLVEELNTLAEVFLQHGVTTAAFSANPLICAERNFDQGFEGFFEHAQEDSDLILPDVVQWLRENSENRFFLYLHLLDAHTPYSPDPIMRERFCEEPPAGFTEQMTYALLKAHLSGELEDTTKLDQFVDFYSSLYSAEVATLDARLSSFFATLTAMGLDDRTVIAITSDHGEEFMEHMMLGHGRQFFSESMQIPLIMLGPGVPSGERVDARVENRYLAPTLLAAANLAAPESMPLVNLLEATGESNPEEKTIFFTTSLGRWPNGPQEHRDKTLQIHGCLKERWLYVWAPKQNNLEAEQHQLFDLYSDTEGKENVATRNVVRMASLKEEIVRWLEEGAVMRVDAFTDQALAEELMRGLGYIGEADDVPK